MKQVPAIGVDLGGQNLRIALVTPAGIVREGIQLPVGSDRSAAAVARQIGEGIRAIVAKEGGVRLPVGCGIPGIVDADQGLVHASPNFPPWHDEPIASMISAECGCDVHIDNDANLHALGEAVRGAGRGHRNTVMLTLGTGIGGGLVFDGRVFHGDAGFAGEVGHIVVEPEGPVCGCGGRGCLELYAAARGFRLLASRLPSAERDALLAAAGLDLSALTPEVMARLDDAGERIARQLWQEFGRYLGIGIATLVNVLGVMTFVIGGGITRSWERFQEEARRSALEHTYPHHAERLRLLRAELGEDAGVLGAAIHACAE